MRRQKQKSEAARAFCSELLTIRVLLPNGVYIMVRSDKSKTLAALRRRIIARAQKMNCFMAVGKKVKGKVVKSVQDVAVVCENGVLLTPGQARGLCNCATLNTVDVPTVAMMSLEDFTNGMRMGCPPVENEQDLPMVEDDDDDVISDVSGNEDDNQDEEQ